MTARQIRTEPQPDPAHHYDGMAAEAALLKLAQAYPAPGGFPYSPNPEVREAFRAGMALGRRMERQDRGVHVPGASAPSPRAVLCAGFDPAEPEPFAPTAHGKTGLYFLIAASAVAAAVSVCLVLL